MSQGSRIGKTYASGSLLKYIPDNQILVEAAMRRGQSMTALIEPQTPSMQRIELATWKNAMLAALNVDYPNRNPMHTVYDNIQIDNTLTSLIETRILKAQQAKFMIVDKAGKPDAEAMMLFEKEWFQKFIEGALTSIFEGPVLLEIFDFNPETGELADCTRVNKFHVKPEKGLVTKEPNDDKGWDYTQNPYYIIVGDVKKLGLLYKVAPHILAKKFALGTWAEFNEKIGIPFRTVHTNTTDKKRHEQLAIIMDKMGSAGWAVLNENEKVELLSAFGTDPTKCFENLIAKLDSEAAMLINGQSSTSNSQDNKGTYGSMKILQDISEDRHESDLVLLKYLINGVLIPRLMQLSPAYSRLKDRYFAWDKSEDLTASETVDYVTKLADYYDIDPEWITKKTGVPILGVKKQPTSAPAVDPKKKNLTAKVNALYGDKCCSHSAPVAVNSNGFEADVLRVAKLIFEGKQNGVVDIPLLKKTAAELRSALISGYKTDDTEKNIELNKQLERNVYVFSGFKTYQQLRDITDKLKDENGNLRSFSEFKKEVLAVNQNYNVRYLSAEYEHAVVSAQMASKWLDIQANKKILPYLEFDATLDNRTTSVCRNLDGTRLPVDDPFWNNYYLPLHWGERSEIRQVASGTVSDKSKIDAPELQPMFKGNVGKDGVMFPDTHPYYEASRADKKQILEAVNKVFPDPNDFKKVYTGKNGGSVSVHSLHHKDELKSNTAVAKILADNTHQVQLLSYAEGRKNPDASIDGKVADFKAIEEKTKSAIQNNIKHTAAQKAQIAVISLLKGVDDKDIVSALYAALFDSKRNKTITEVWFITSAKKLIKINRSDIVSGTIKKVL